ncbi:MAG: efflux RND transporter periplasmic adaptor subunit, partial [Betaproteobacteria bacterium]|nr:efflux RND transporter periplasmic adaptor subunit [Betaproteobacteria bacterium]
MKSSRILVPAALLGAGIAVGWFVASQRHDGSTVPAATPAAQGATQAPAPHQVNDTITAPAGGFDPAFVKVAQVELGLIPDMISISGKLAFDAEHLHLVSSRVAGRLDRILIFEGAKVAQGQPLAELYSPDWISAQNELLLARNTVRTFASANQKDLLEDARGTEESARNRMRVLGASDEDIARVEKSGVVATHLSLRAPIA